MVAGLARGYHFFCLLGDHGTDQRGHICVWWLRSIEVDYKDVEGGEVLLHMEENSPVQTQNAENKYAQNQRYQ